MKQQELVARPGLHPVDVSEFACSVKLQALGGLALGCMRLMSVRLCEVWNNKSWWLALGCMLLMSVRLCEV